MADLNHLILISGTKGTLAIYLESLHDKLKFI